MDFVLIEAKAYRQLRDQVAEIAQLAQQFTQTRTGYAPGC